MDRFIINYYEAVTINSIGVQMPHMFSFDGFDHFENSSSSNHPQEDDNLFSEPQVFSTFRFIVCRSILMEYIWYDGDDIPENPHVKFPILLNPKWANDLNFKDSDWFWDLTLSQVRFLFRQFKKPEWALQTKLETVEISLHGGFVFMNQYKNRDPSNMPKDVPIMNQKIRVHRKRVFTEQIVVNIEKAQQWFYVRKILGVVWFEGELPYDRTTPFTIKFHDQWSNNIMLPESVSEIIDLSVPELEYLCARILVPEWTTSPDAENLDLTLQDARILMAR